ncbi:MAG: UDP-N-acetylglucosamine 2-epimerase [Mucinivorans sp.]
MRKICLVTGSRAEWGLLSRLAAMIKADQELQLQIIATNMHLSERYGLTYKEIEAAGFVIDYRVPMEAALDTAAEVVQSMGVAMQGFASAYQALQPDLLVVLGDRYEILVAVSAALIFNIPVAHLHGGEITQGAFDDAIRHSITKMSQLHFTSTQEYARRVIQMGEQPSRVFNVGAIGVDNIKRSELWSKADTEKSLGEFALDRHTVLVTFHPVTMEPGMASVQIDELLCALDELHDLRVIFTMPNSDTGARVIEEKIGAWCAANSERAVCFSSLGRQRYLSVLQYIGAVLGNSSSGIIEVPSFGIPTINIGNRQKGRIKAASVSDCLPLRGEIAAKLSQAMAQDYTLVANPYEKADTAQEILQTLKSISLKDLTIKQFHTIAQ